MHTIEISGVNNRLHLEQKNTFHNFILICIYFLFQNLFKPFVIDSVEELTLGANLKLSDLHRLKWKTKMSNGNKNMSRVMRKPTFWFPTWSDTNQAVHLQKVARGLKFRIQTVGGLYYL